MNLKEKAREFATKAHEGQTRKGSGLPMISHPIRVAEQLEKAGFPDYVVAAGYLHDTVEDTEVTLEDIVETFGDKTALVVKGNTENKEDSWEERKSHTIEAIKDAHLYVKSLVVADKLDNLNSLIEDYERIGEDIWSKFKRGREKQQWYFSKVSENMCIGLNKDEIPNFFYEYERKVKSFFNQ